MLNSQKTGSDSTPSSGETGSGGTPVSDEEAKILKEEVKSEVTSEMESLEEEE